MYVMSQETHKKEMTSGMAAATKVISFAPSEKTDKKEMICGMAAATKIIPFLPSEKTDKKQMINEMAAGTKVIPFLPSEKTDKKEMIYGYFGCDESHSISAVRIDTQKRNGWRMQRKSFPFCRQTKLTKRK